MVPRRALQSMMRQCWPSSASCCTCANTCKYKKLLGGTDNRACMIWQCWPSNTSNVAVPTLAATAKSCEAAPTLVPAPCDGVHDAVSGGLPQWSMLLPVALQRCAREGPEAGKGWMQSLECCSSVSVPLCNVDKTVRSLQCLLAVACFWQVDGVGGLDVGVCRPWTHANWHQSSHRLGRCSCCRHRLILGCHDCLNHPWVWWC